MSKKTDTTRRAIVGATVGVGLGLGAISMLVPIGALKPKKEVTPETEPPKKGDVFVFAEGDKKGEEIAFDDLPKGGPFVLAFPKDPKTGVIKNGERNNMVLLIRLDPAELSAETAEYAADGTVAYSAICTHLGCTVSDWVADKGDLLCPCHKGIYDPRQGAKVIGGPPPRPLPALPLQVGGDKPVCAGGFTSPVGVVAGLEPQGGSCAV
ncbi:ubiquinol-cytochrome c reductase iron-sulfur subunit [Deinococcota bacterium DY0809b]